MHSKKGPVETLGLRMNTEQSGHRSVTALVAFEPGDALSPFRGNIQAKATRHTLQVGPSEHLLLEPEILQYVNHSCDPNVVFDIRRRTLRAIRAIAPGD